MTSIWSGAISRGLNFLVIVAAIDLTSGRGYRSLRLRVNEQHTSINLVPKGQNQVLSINLPQLTKYDVRACYANTVALASVA